MRPSQTLNVLEDLAVKQQGRLTRNGVELSLQDSLTVKDVYTQWVLLLIDLDYLSLVSKRLLTAQVLSDLFKSDVFELVTALNDCVDNIRYQRKDGFKARLDSVSPCLFKVFKDSFLDCLAGDERQARRLIQAFSYMGRLSLRDIDLTNQCLSDYLATEQNMKDDYPPSLIRSLKSIIKRWTSGFDPTDLTFSHGPGGVAGLGRTTLENKYKSLFRDELIDRVFKFDYWTGINTAETITVTPDRISQTIFVPKSYKTFRTISMEPATLMYLQQGVWKEIDRMVLRNPYLRNRINFHDQVRNQKLAREGSLLRNYATIDLSAASDSVSWKLVRDLFGETSLFPYLEATRSTQTFLPNNQLVDLKKFAPMGSALCFPIETLIFAAICEHSCRKVSRVRDNDVAGDYSVFGDDIIVPTSVVKDLEWSLTALGFSINNSKSFTNPDDWFRESCGAEYCNGFDVTPLRVSRKYASVTDVKSLTGCVELSNSCYKKGFLNLRAFFLAKMHRHYYVIKREKLIRVLSYKPLFSEGAVIGDSYTNHHTKTRYNLNLQRNEAYATILKSSTTRGDEEIALRHWLESATRRTGEIQTALTAKVGQRVIDPQNRWCAIKTRIEIEPMQPTESEPNLELFKQPVGMVLYPLGV